MKNVFSSDAYTRQFLVLLREELDDSLPGVDAHLKLAPEFRVQELKTEEPPATAMESSVLILLYPRNGRLFTVVILRNEYDGAHSGQISLPGGKNETTDLDFEHTALRETQEEIGINPADIKVIGQLSRFYVRPSNFIIYPFIAFTPERPEFVPDSTEVQKIIEVDILNEISYLKIVNRTLTVRNNIQINAPGFIVGGEFMWGATAMIFSELLHVITIVTEKLKQT